MLFIASLTVKVMTLTGRNVDVDVWIAEGSVETIVGGVTSLLEPRNS